MTPSTRSLPAVLALSLWIFIAMPAVAGGDLRQLFPRTAAIELEGSGLHRLDLPETVLAACSSDLADLRILTADGREVPFALVPASVASGDDEVIARLPVHIREVERHEQRRPDGPPLFHERYLLKVPPLPAGAGGWQLVLDPRPAQFVCRIELTAAGDRGRPARMVSTASAFRLHAPPAEHLRFSLPEGNLETLEVRLAGENSSYIEPAFELEALRRPPSPQPLVVPLTLLAVQQGEGRTLAIFRRPRGVVPARLRLSTATGAFHRVVRAWDEGPGGHGEIARGTVYRVNAFAPVENLDLAVRPAAGDRIRLEIDDRDSPPLQALACSALVPAPALVFSPPPGGGALALFFGGRRAHHPDYDLAAFTTALTRRKTWTPSSMLDAHLQAPFANPRFDPAPALAFVMHAGAEMDRAPYSHLRRLDVRPSAEGLARLELLPRDLALLRPDLADLRVVDGSDHQWAYLLTGRHAFSPEAVQIDRKPARRNASRYVLSLPASPIEAAGLTVDSTSPFFDRSYSLVGTLADGSRRTLATGRLARHRGRHRPIRISFPGVRVTGLELVVQNGDDAPLELVRAEVGVQHPVLFLPAPAGAYTLLLGDPAAAPPRYELTSARSTILAVPAAVITAGPVESNPNYSARARIAGATSLRRLLLWAALVLAVLVLAVLTLRLARQEGRTPTEP
ncbi:MAG: DUF3999 domain-containing protein [Acidobacteria bacterium]|nr:DUF3999 domain-containing protein [Acidobacteriota bacterium]